MNANSADIPNLPKKHVLIVSTGAANLASVMAAFKRAGAIPELTEEQKVIQTADYLVLPGVGSFGAAMKHLKYKGLTAALSDRLHEGRPTLAICVGLQILAESSSESPNVPGLGFFKNTAVERFAANVRVPQFGWNQVCLPTTAPTLKPKFLQAGYAYFANSYCLKQVTTPLPQSVTPLLIASSHYGQEFIAAIEYGNLLACQFHPELSGGFGLALLQRWLAADEHFSNATPIT